MRHSKLWNDIRKTNAEINAENRAKLKALYEEHLKKGGVNNAEAETEQYGVLESRKKDVEK